MMAACLTFVDGRGRDRNLAGSLPRQDPRPMLTTRLALVEPDLSHATGLARALADFDVARMLVDLPQPFHPGDALDWILTWRNGDRPGNARVLTLRQEHAGFPLGQPAGVVTLEEKASGPVLDYWLARPLWGARLMGEAVSTMLARHFATRPDCPVRSGIMVDNPASLRLQERLGFAITGVRDVWSLPRGRMVHLIETELVADRFTPDV